MLKKICFLLMMIVMLYFPSNISALNATAEEQRQALIETAKAYYRQGNQLQYDSFRKNLYSTPEDATSQHFTYTVCSGFVFSTYYHTLGIKVPDTTEGLLDYAKANKDKSAYIIKYYGSKEEISVENVLGVSSSDETSYYNLADEWADILKPGDIFVVTGHAMLVESVDYENKKVTIIESGGGTRYNYDKHIDRYDENGTVQYRSLVQKLYTFNNYIGTENEIEEMAIIRIISDDGKYIDTNNQIKEYEGITESSKSRLTYKNIDIEKTVKIADSKSSIFANIGDEITYNITIKNNSNSNYSNLKIVEEIDPNLSAVNIGDGSLENNKVSWNISNLNASDSITLSYTVEVPKQNTLLGKVVVSTGKVDNIPTSRIEILIGNRLTPEQQQDILTSFNNLKQSSKIEREFINQIYLDSLNLDMGLANLSNLDIIGYEDKIASGGHDTLSIKKTMVKNLSQYIYHNFYGLRIGLAEDSENSVVRAILQWNIYPTLETNDRARTITEDMLIDGDVVLVYTGNLDTTDENLANKAYIYLNNVLYRKTAVNTLEEISGDDLTVFLRNIVGDNYIILRPSLAMKSNDIEIEESNQNSKEEIKNETQLEQNVENPNTRVDFVYKVLVSILLISGISYLLIRKKSMFKKHD